MPRKRKERPRDLIDELLDEMYRRQERGERVGIAYILEQLLNAIMERERQNFLQKLEGAPTQFLWKSRGVVVTTPTASITAPSTSPSAPSTSKSLAYATPDPSDP